MTSGDLNPPSELRLRLMERYAILDGTLLRRLTEAGLLWLRANQATVNALNVFPVPDGDTGTNMTLTMQAAWNEIAQSDEASVGQVSRAIAHGALMGARGNSGVILSQLWRGFARSMDERHELDAAQLARALREARTTAYKGVVRPVEGTILTVSSAIAEAAERLVQEGGTSALELLEEVVLAADESVRRTPELLPILKEAGVVDSGGKGLYYILEGMLRAAYRLPLDQPANNGVVPLSSFDLNAAAEAIEPGQDWEVVVDFRPTAQLDLARFYEQLESMGTSIQVGEGEGMYRMHIHVPDDTQYKPVDYIRSLGTVTKVAFENLMEQTGSAGLRPAEVKPASIAPGQIGVVAVAPGTGLARVFASLGAAAIVEGGQTMNPSTQEILAAVEGLPTETVIILPNNKNVILAASQAVKMTGKQARVVGSVSIPQGIAAILALDPDGDFEEVFAAMRQTASSVKSIEITAATRSAFIDEVQVEQGQIIALLDGKLAASNDSLLDTVMQVLERAKAGQAELITLYYGLEMKPAQAEDVAERIRQIYDQLEVELVEGGQPHYLLIISIE
jgi:DAK2 domain fusion protein YloV